MRFLAGLLLGCVALPALAQDLPKAKLKENVRVAIVGDSITEQKIYSRYVADYLYACMPQLKAHVVQFGWGGERAGGFAARLENDLMPFKPDVVTTCYGMNDGEYTAFRKDIGDRYQAPMKEIVAKIKKSGATAVVGSPGAVDQYSFRRGKDEGVSKQSVTYNDNLGHLRDIAKAIAVENGLPFANVHDAMVAAMVKAQEKLGDKYTVGGNDGVHPGPNGQLAMAYAFLKAMDLDGDLGTISVDMKGESTAKNGHTIIKAHDGVVEVESSRYPFCFNGDPKSAAGTRSILPYLPFNAELNRLTLVVTNAPAEKMKVTWGKESMTYTKEQLAKGVNLAADFVEHPLAEAFMKVDARVADQQNLQTAMIKGVITNHRQVTQMFKGDTELADALGKVRDILWTKEEAKHKAVAAAVVPVKHTLTITAAE